MSKPTTSNTLGSLVSVGVLKSTLLPNLQFHTGLAVPAYFLARTLNHVEIKDHLWSLGQVLNAWWTAVGRHVILEKHSLSTVLYSLSNAESVLLGGVTLWGVRLWYREISRRLSSSKDDDPRYDTLKADPSGWNYRIPALFITEAVIQSLVSLPFTAPFRAIPNVGIRDEYAGYLSSVAIGVWSAGFVLELLADSQLASHQSKGEKGLLRSGVWSIVRHPNYLGDTLLHLSYPLYLFSQTLFNPITLLGPLTNWYFLRNISGDKENEQSQEERYARDDPLKRVELAEYRDEKNAFWPAVSELGNIWTWIVIGSGVAGSLGVKYVGEYLKRHTAVAGGVLSV